MYFKYKMEEYLKNFPNPFCEKTSELNCETSLIQNGDTYYTRNTGRTANQLYEYVIWRLKAFQDSKKFVSTYNNLPFKCESYVNYNNGIKGGINLGIPELIEPYPHNHEYYRGKTKLIESFFPEICNIKPNNNIVIHLRLDDILNYLQSYTLLPRYFYENIRFKRDSNVQIVANCINKEQEQFVSKFVSFLADKFPQVCFFYKGNQTVEQDFHDIISCKKLIASTSTFWYFPTLLSRNVKKIVVPYYGVTKLMFPYGIFKCEFIRRCIFVDIPLKEKMKSFEQFWDS